MPEAFWEWNVDAWIKTWTPQVDNFSKELSDFLLDEKLTNKEQISNLLVLNPDLKTWFENFLKIATPVQKLKCKKELKNCSIEDEIKSIIIENLPDWYKIWNNDVVENVEISEDLVWDDILLSVTEQSDQDTEQARIDTEEEVQKKEDVGEKVKLNETIELRQQLLKNCPDQEKAKKLDEDTRKEAEKIKSKISEQTKNQLKEKGYDENFINDYILLRVTANEVRNDSSFDKNAVAQFESKVNELSSLDIILKNIDNDCNIADTYLGSFSTENISQTRAELFNKDVWNEDLREVKKNNIESISHKEKYNEMFPEMEDDEMFTKYGCFLQWDLKVFWLQYQTNPDIRNKISNAQNNSTGENEKLLENYQKMHDEILRIKNDYETKTRDMVEDLCIISQIKWMYMCMWEWENFNLNKANEIESEDWVLTLRWHIDWVDFAIRQDTTKELPLQTSSKLAKDEESADDMDKNNDFILWSSDKFVNSNFILPTQDEIFTAITEIVKSDNSLENADNQEKCLENLQKNIMWNMEKKYESTKYVHDYMQEQVKWERIIDKTISFVKKLKGASVDSRIDNSNIQLYDFLNLMNFNIKYSTSVEKDNLYKIMDKIDSMASLAQDKSFDWELSNHQDRFAQYLTWESLLNTRKILYGNVIEWESTKYAFDLFKNYENLSDERKIWGLYMINFDQMLVDLNKVEVQQKERKEKTTRDLAELSQLDKDLEIAYA